MKNAFMEKYDFLFDKHGQIMEKILLKGTFLNRQIQPEKVLTSEEIQKVRNDLILDMETYQKFNLMHNPEPTTDNSEDEIESQFDYLVESGTNTQLNCGEELHLFETLRKNCGDCETFWWEYRTNLPKLYPIAMRVLSTLSTSASVERQNLKSGLIDTPLRNRLSRQSVEALSLISGNWDLVKPVIDELLNSFPF